ncbi:sulfur carrier protein ThiS [Vibrio gallicus]|uniref:sulfur carrier protein ThiS n=1 Tax=Vibrio gallicus TaxID=190897 RepID=UPI0021C26ADC|nr:sulfur carrier protein ThiS [Vibrio gallicus]
MSEISIKFNDKSLALATVTTVKQFIQQQELPESGFAIALNNKVVPKAEWGNVQIEHGDSVNLFRAIAGG